MLLYKNGNVIDSITNIAKGKIAIGRDFHYEVQEDDFLQPVPFEIVIVSADGVPLKVQPSVSFELIFVRT